MWRVCVGVCVGVCGCVCLCVSVSVCVSVESDLLSRLVSQTAGFGTSPLALQRPMGNVYHCLGGSLNVRACAMIAFACVHTSSMRTSSSLTKSSLRGLLFLGFEAEMSETWFRLSSFHFLLFIINLFYLFLQFCYMDKKTRQPVQDCSSRTSLSPTTLQKKTSKFTSNHRERWVKIKNMVWKEAPDNSRTCLRIMYYVFLNIKVVYFKRWY